MKKYFLYIPALALLAAACDKVDNNEPAPIEEEPTPVVKMVTETVSASRGVVTKATISNADASFAWTVGDNVAVHVSKGNSHEYVITSKSADAAASSAKFEVTYGEGYSRDAFAVYPSTIVAATAANYGQSGSPLDVTLPGSYKLAEVSGETSPGPMISTNNAGENWEFHQLCGLLRLTVNDIPSTAKRLEIDFNGKKVCGAFSITSPVTPGSSVIETADDTANDCITITKDGSNVAFGSTSLVLNIPLPTGAYKKITVLAYDALTGGNALEGMTVQFDYTADNSHATKRATALGPLQSIFNFTFKNSGTELTNVRFARVFSVLNKLHNGTSTYGPITASADTDLASPVKTALYFDQNPGDQLAFQVVTGDGKVYSGLVDTPAGGYDIGKNYDVTADVNLYTFTISSGKKVCFSPGDLGVDNGVFLFTEPFTSWGQGNTSETELAKRVWFDQYTFGLGERSVYGIDSWRIPGYVSSAYEWNNIVNRSLMKDGVAAYYRVTIPGHQYCLLLPPDETTTTDIGSDITSGTVTDYVKYLGKGFVLLMNTNRGIYVTEWSWGSSTGTYAKQGYYWAVRDGSQRYYFETKESGAPAVSWGANRMRNYIRFVHDTTTP